MLLPLGLDPKKKRKSSSIDHSMWSDQQSGLGRQGPSGSGGSGGTASGSGGVAVTLTRNRAFVLLLLLLGFMFFSVSSTSLLHGGGDAAADAARARLRSSTDRAVALATPPAAPGASSRVITFPDAVVVTPRPHLRAPEPEARLRPPRPDSFGIVVVADLDKKSKDASSKKPAYFSFLQHGTLRIAGGGDHETYAVKWGATQKLTTTMNEAGRGFELSELAWFRGELLTFDDRTGIVYRLKNFEGAAKPVVAIPEHIVMEGDGLAGKGQKHEWATVKDNELYMGSVGKEFTDNDGNVISDSNLWVAILDEHGDIRHEDWTANFARIRSALGCEYPGYVIHEAIEWSSVHRKWFILPRRVSTEPYNDELDERRGSNKLVIASEDFSSFEILEVGRVTPLRGFSSFKFVPRTEDSVIVAIKSVEVEAEQTQTSYLTVFDIHGKVLLDETELPGGYKYEGIAFEHDWS